MGDSLPVTKLTNNELDELAASKGVELSKADTKNKASRLDAIEKSGKVTDADYEAALVKAGHIEAPAAKEPEPAAGDDGDDGTQPETDENTPPATTGNPSPAKAKSTPPAERNVAGVPDDADDDPFAGEDLDDDLPGPIASREPLPEFTEADLPRLRELGASVRRIEKLREHPNGGGTTWWCPWTDDSRLSPDEPGTPDKIASSNALRVGRFAVVLPPGGIDPRKLRRR